MNQLQAAPQSHHGKHYILSPALQTGEREAKKQTTTKETQNQPHSKQHPPKNCIGKKKPPQDIKFGTALPQHSHSWMEKKGMLEGCGMMAASGTVWQWVDRLRLNRCYSFSLTQDCTEKDSCSHSRICDFLCHRFLSAGNVPSCTGKWGPMLWLMSSQTAPPLEKQFPAPAEGSLCPQMAIIRQVLSSAFT